MLSLQILADDQEQRATPGEVGALPMHAIFFSLLSDIKLFLNRQAAGLTQCTFCVQCRSSQDVHNMQSDLVSALHGTIRGVSCEKIFKNSQYFGYLTVSKTSPGFYVSAVQVFLKTLWGKEKLLVTSISPLPTVFPTLLKSFLSFSSNLKLSSANS